MIRNNLVENVIITLSNGNVVKLNVNNTPNSEGSRENSQNRFYFIKNKSSIQWLGELYTPEIKKKLQDATGYANDSIRLGYTAYDYIVNDKVLVIYKDRNSYNDVMLSLQFKNNISYDDTIKFELANSHEIINISEFMPLLRMNCNPASFTQEKTSENYLRYIVNNEKVRIESRFGTHDFYSTLDIAEYDDFLEIYCVITK